jgi:hypothetical protein
VQQESLNLQYAHVWYSTDTDGGAEAAVMITNTGGRDVVISNLEVRGQIIPWTNVFEYTLGKGEASLTDLYYFDQTNTSVTALKFTNHTYTLFPNPNPMNGTLSTTALANPPTLKSGYSLVLYMTTLGYNSTATTNKITSIPPGSVTVNDVGLTISIAVFTAQATYYKETNVNAISAAS